MRRPLIVVCALLLGLSACTPEEIDLVVSEYARTQSEPAGVVEQASATGAGDCDVLDVRIVQPEGTRVFVSVGSQPPYGFTVGSGAQWQFVTVDGVTTGHLLIGTYEHANGYVWNIERELPGVAVGQFTDRVAEGTVVCP